MTGATEQYGIRAFAAYLPRWRIARSTISEAIGWSRGMSSPGKGERSFAHWDEDCITMAVEAGHRLHGGHPFDSLQLASTSLPFADRSNSGIVREALNLDAVCRSFDLSGSRRSATSWLAQSLNDRVGKHLLIASDCVDAKPGSESELLLGHGSAALVIGNLEDGHPLLARCLASRSLHQDFVDQYRMADQRYDYRLESRWIRDAGTRDQLGELIRDVLDAADCKTDEIQYLVLPTADSVSRTIARDNDLNHAQRPTELEQKVGLCGAAQPLLGLCWALGKAAPGEHILLAGLGQGADVMLLRVEETAGQAGRQLQIQFDRGQIEDNYSRYLGLRRLMPIDGGIRAERDNRSALSAHFRHHQDLTGFVGGRCSACGQLQFPRAEICVECRESGTQSPEAMAELTGTINSYTEDWLAYTPRPPLIFGSVHFPGGANLTAEFGDFLPGEAAVGQSVRMAFRIKDRDEKRHFQRYFWKPIPLDEVADHG